MQREAGKGKLDIFALNKGERKRIEAALNGEINDPIRGFFERLATVRRMGAKGGDGGKTDVVRWMMMLRKSTGTEHFAIDFSEMMNRKGLGEPVFPPRLRAAMDKLFRLRDMGVIEFKNEEIRLRGSQEGKVFKVDCVPGTRAEASEFISQFNAQKEGFLSKLGSFRLFKPRPEKPPEAKQVRTHSEEIKEILEFEAGQKTGGKEAMPAAPVEEAIPEKGKNEVQEVGMPAEELEKEEPARPPRRKFGEMASEAWGEFKRDARIIFTFGMGEHRPKLMDEEMDNEERRLREEHDREFRKELRREKRENIIKSVKAPFLAVSAYAKRKKEERAESNSEIPETEKETAPAKKAASAKALRYAAFGTGVAAIAAIGGYSAYHFASRAPTVEERRIVQPAKPQPQPQAVEVEKAEPAPSAEEKQAEKTDKDYEEAQRKIRLMRIERKAAEIREKFESEGESKADEEQPKQHEAHEGRHMAELAQKAKEDPQYSEAYSFITSKFKEGVQDSVARGVLKAAGKEKMKEILDDAYERVPDEFKK